MVCGILVPPPGMAYTAPAVEAWSLHHWTARDFPPSNLYIICITTLNCNYLFNFKTLSVMAMSHSRIKAYFIDPATVSFPVRINLA